jgi:hypothetical protein
MLDAVCALPVVLFHGCFMSRPSSGGRESTKYLDMTGSRWTGGFSYFYNTEKRTESRRFDDPIIFSHFITDLPANTEKNSLSCLSKGDL